jgi:hypothetical protein
VARLELPDPLSDLDDDPFRRTRPPWRATGAVSWATAAGVASGGGWWAGLTAARHLFGLAVLDPAPAGQVLDAALVLGGLTAALGAVVGGVAGLVCGGSGRAVVGGVAGLVGAALGAAGGGLSPLLAAAAGGALPPELSSALAWVAIGFLGGVVGYTWGREPGEAAAGAEEPAGPPRSATASGRGLGGPVGRVLPAATVAVCCIIAALVAPPSAAGWAVLAVGLLGLGVVWALIGQERRLRELERRVTRGRDRAEPDGMLSAGDS